MGPLGLAMRLHAYGAIVKVPWVLFGIPLAGVETSRRSPRLTETLPVPVPDCAPLGIVQVRPAFAPFLRSVTVTLAVVAFDTQHAMCVYVPAAATGTSPCTCPKAGTTRPNG